MHKKIQAFKPKKVLYIQMENAGTYEGHVRTPTLTATSSFSNVPLKQIWSKLSIILGGTTCKSKDNSNTTGIHQGKISDVQKLLPD